MSKFKTARTLNTRLFERDYLSMLDTVFSAAALPPVFLSNADDSQGRKYVEHNPNYENLQ